MTTPSPKRVGNVETLKSTTFLLPMRILIRPSWGRRFSAMSISDMILRRDSTVPCSDFGTVWTSRHFPSTRYRIRTRSARGSTWMSEALWRTPSLMIESTSRTTGAPTEVYSPSYCSRSTTWPSAGVKLGAARKASGSMPAKTDMPFLIFSPPLSGDR